MKSAIPMNREQIRQAGVSKATSEQLKQLRLPCTVMEAIQLAESVAKDTIDGYHQNINPIIISLSIQIEVLKDMLMRSQIIEEGGVATTATTPILSEQDFIDKFNERLADYEKKSAEAFKAIEAEIEAKAQKSSYPSTEVEPMEVEITTEN